MSEEVFGIRRDQWRSPDLAPDPVVAPARLWKQPPLSVYYHFKWLVQAAEMLRFQSLCLLPPVYYRCFLFQCEEPRVCYLVLESHWWSRSRERTGSCDLTLFFFISSLTTCCCLLHFRCAVCECGDAVNVTHSFSKRKPFALLSFTLPPVERRCKHKVKFFHSLFMTRHMMVTHFISWSVLHHLPPSYELCQTGHPPCPGSTVQEGRPSGIKILTM